MSGTTVGRTAADRVTPTPRERRWSSNARPSAPSSRSGTAKAANTSEFRSAVRKTSSWASSRKLSSPTNRGLRIRSYSVSASANVIAAGSATSAVRPSRYGASMSASCRRSAQHHPLPGRAVEQMDVDRPGGDVHRVPDSRSGRRVGAGDELGAFGAHVHERLAPGGLDERHLGGDAVRAETEVLRPDAELEPGGPRGPAAGACRRPAAGSSRGCRRSEPRTGSPASPRPRRACPPAARSPPAARRRGRPA